MWMPLALRIRGDLEIAAGNPSEALDYYRSSLGEAERLGAVFFALKAKEALVACFREVGKETEAATLIENINRPSPPSNLDLGEVLASLSKAQS
jgi:hypothetical protein